MVTMMMMMMIEEKKILMMMNDINGDHMMSKMLLDLYLNQAQFLILSLVEA
jgi:TRAP-type mannitol/chloroaromatic compound transport system permease large subunit